MTLIRTVGSYLPLAVELVGREYRTGGEEFIWKIGVER